MIELSVSDDVLDAEELESIRRLMAERDQLAARVGAACLELDAIKANAQRRIEMLLREEQAMAFAFASRRDMDGELFRIDLDTGRISKAK